MPKSSARSSLLTWKRDPVARNHHMLTFGGQFLKISPFRQRALSHIHWSSLHDHNTKSRRHEICE